MGDIPSDRRAHLRGQTNVADMLVATIVFVVAFAGFIMLSDRAYRDTLSASKFDGIAIAGTSITESFVGSGGVPSDWETNSSNAQAIGLADSQNYLSHAKIKAFTLMTYNLSKTKIGLPPGIDYRFIVVNMSNATLYQSGVVLNKSQTITPFRRSIIVNGSPAELRLILYG